MNEDDRDKAFEIESAKEIFKVDDNQDNQTTPPDSIFPKHVEVRKGEEKSTFDPFRGIVFPKLCDVFDCIRQGNFLPLIALMQKEPSTDLSKTDLYGYSAAHYATTFGNIQVLELLYEAKPDCLNTLSKGWQTPLMLACANSNPEVLHFIGSRVSSMRLDETDNWGFTPLTYCVKNNFVAGFFYLLYKGARLDKQYTDRSGDSFSHWAAHNDRKFLLEFLHRAGFDLKRKGSKGQTVFDKALENWSLHSLVYMLQYSMISLDTFQLIGVGNEFMLDLVPQLEHAQVKAIKSSYIPAQLKRIGRANSITGGNLNLPISFGAGLSFLMETGTEGLTLLWKKFSNRRAFILSGIGNARPIAVLLLTLAFLATPVYFLASTWYLFVAIFLLQLSLYQLVLLGRGQKAAGAEVPENERSMYDKIKIDLSKYYVPEAEYQAYLERSELNHPIVHYFGKLFDRKDWDAIAAIDTRDFCPTCMIRKRPKVRHVKEVNLCVAKYHCYSDVLQTPIYFANEGLYLGYHLCLFLFALCTLKHFVVKSNEEFLRNWFTFPARVFGYYWLDGAYIKATLLVFLAWFILWTGFRLLVFVYCTSAGLTLDEVYHPEHYSYLFVESEMVKGKFSYQNPHTRGFFRNWWTFIAQRWSRKPLIPEL